MVMQTGYMLTLAELSRELDTPPEVIKDMARYERLPFSFFPSNGFAVHRRDLDMWRCAVERDRRQK